MLQPQFIAEVHLFSTGEGGYQSPCHSGIFFNLSFDGLDGTVGTKTRFVGAEYFQPGGRRKVELTFAELSHLPMIKPGLDFLIREGRRIIGEGRIEGDLR